LFLFGIAVGAVASLGVCLILIGARRRTTKTHPDTEVHHPVAG
jgi:hypothetical protein